MGKANGLKINDEVKVFSFGVHKGLVAGFAPTVEIQGRAAVRKYWITVQLHDGRVWHGTPDDVAVIAPAQAAIDFAA